MTTYLITGGGGYVAASLVRAIEREGGTVRRLAREGLTRRDDVARALDGSDVVFHLAAQTSVPVAEADPIADATANVLPMLHLLEACRGRGGSTAIIFASTATVCGIPARMPVDESTPDDPLTIYDLHKLTAERYLRHYCTSGAVRGGTLRLANVYGPGPKSSRPDRGVLNAMVRKALAGETLKIYGSGEWLRDYIYVDEVARAFMLAAKHADALQGRRFLLASGVGHTLADAIRLVARLVEERTGRPVPIEHVEPAAPMSPIETRSFVARPDALREATGFHSSVSLEQGLLSTIEYHAAAMEER